MAKASQFTTTGTINPAEDYIPYMKKVGSVYTNAKVTALNAGIQQPDYVARSSASAAQSQANAATDVADTALDIATFGTGAARSAAAIATVALDTAWAGTAAAREARAVAQTALVTGWAGTSAGVAAYNIGKTALETAWLGTNADAALSASAEALRVATAGLSTSWAGTAAAREANSVGSAALTTAWTGTTLASTAYDLATYAIGLTGTASSGGGGGADLATAWAGTAAAREARAVAQTALETAWAGTSRADLAYQTAISGTIGSQTITVSGGTAVLDMAGQAYQIVNLTGATTITVTNQQAHTANRVQSITARIVGGTDAVNVTCDNFEWMTDPLTSVAAGDTVYLGLVSFGTAVNQISATALIEDTRFIAMYSNSLAAFGMSRTALDTSWVGTASANAAVTIANTAYQTAISGTVGSTTVPVASGTAVLNMAGQSFQTVNITGDTVIDMTGMLPITATRVQEITARLVGDSNAHNVTCANFDWMTDPVTTIGANQEIFIGFVSFGSTVNNVYATALIEDTRILSISQQADDSYKLARAAYTLAQAGTVSHSTTSASAGTVVFSMSGSAYQSVVIGGDTAITVTNIQAPSATHIQAVTARIHNNNSGSNFNLFWDAFGIVGQAPPASVTNNHSVFASFTSYGTNVQNVFLATGLHV